MMKTEEEPPAEGDETATEEAAVAAPAEEAIAAAELEAIDVEGPSMMKLFFSEMFSPIDGLFILLAFFTAYKVGSGEMGD